MLTEHEHQTPNTTGRAPGLAPHHSEEEAVRMMNRARPAPLDRITIQAPQQQLQVVLTKAAAAHGGFVYGYDSITNLGTGGGGGGGGGAATAATVRGCARAARSKAWSLVLVCLWFARLID